MRRKTKERIKKLIEKITLIIIQSLILTTLFFGCAWCVGRFINIMENNSIVRITTIIIVIILMLREIIQSAKGE